MELRTNALRFPATRNSGPIAARPRVDTKLITLPANATQATAILTGFNAAFSPSDGDHHLGNLDIRLSTKFVAPPPSMIVEVKATFGLRDWSSEWDDKYEGVVRVAVVAE